MTPARAGKAMTDERRLELWHEAIVDDVEFRVELFAELDRLRSSLARLTKREEEWREAMVAAEQALAGWAAKPEGQIWRHPHDGDQDPNGTNGALAALRPPHPGGNVSDFNPFPLVESASWIDCDRDLMWFSIGGLTFKVTREELESEIHYVSLLWRRIHGAVNAICDGLGWCSGIWDEQWAMSHGSLGPEVEVLW
jgi:hypothetical protein